MKEINLPPFYVGQRIVRVLPLVDDYCKVGGIYICLGLRQCEKCQTWFVDIGCKEERWGDILIEKCTCGFSRQTYDTIIYYEAASFAPITENFQSISLEKVLEEETKLISVN